VSAAASDDVRRQTISGLGWTSSTRIVQQGVQFAFAAVLARILVPFDFGLIAMTEVFTGLAQIFVDLGLSLAIIQRKEITERHLSSAFWLNLSVGGALTLVMMGLAPALSAFYNEPKLVPIVVALAPQFLISSLVGVQYAILQRGMNFRKLALVDTVSPFPGYVLGVILALAGFGVWSLVAVLLAQNALRAAMYWFSSSWRPREGFDSDALRELWGFGSRTAGFNLLTYWSRNADNLLIGRFVGVDELAFYNRAYNLMLLPVSTVGAAVTSVMFPALSRMQDDRERLRRVYLRSIGLLALVTFPTMVGMGVLAGPLILAVYGPNWKPVVGLLQILCLASIALTLSRTTGWIFTSQGRADWLFRWGVVSSGTAILSFIIGLPWGATGVAISYTCWCCLSAIPAFFVAGKLIDLSTVDVLREMEGVVIASTVMGALVWLFEREIAGSWAAVTQLLTGIAVGVVGYVLALHALSPRAYDDFRGLVGEYHRRHRRTTSVS
jgi:O-antigen/teichoic acid export membrane protein